MKKPILIMLLLMAMVSANAEIKVRISNPVETSRELETVELQWKQLIKKDKALNPNNVVVRNGEGDEIASQVVYAGSKTPQLLIFQVCLDGKASVDLTITAGARSEYKPLVFGRFVPERKDDYAWENNLIAFRTYGPALENELVTNGIDIWCKRTQELVINKWYKEDDYHNDKGEGCDVYKVGPTLGAGASAPYTDGKLHFSRNYATWKTLDNGPIRTSVLLSYNTFDGGGFNVELQKIISLDANTHFNKVVDNYSGNFKSMDVAAGMVSHTGAQLFKGKNYVALFEPASDSKKTTDGEIAVGVIMPGMKEYDESGENFVAIKKVTNGKPLIYYFGAGWSNSDITTLDVWRELIEKTELKITNPLIVKYL